MAMSHEVIKVDAKGRKIKAVYCCPSKAVALRIARELRLVSGNKFKVAPCI